MGDGVVTGVTQTTNDDGVPIALVAITLGPQTARLVIGPSNGEPLTVDTEQFEGLALVQVDLEQRDPMMTREIEAVDASGFSVGSARVTPFVQDPLTATPTRRCPKPTVLPAGPSMSVARRAAPPTSRSSTPIWGAPLPAVCD